MEPIHQIFIFIFGTVIGSFLNAVVWRLHARESFLSGRSYCPHCNHPLSALDLLPILSFLLLRGRCRHCSVRINHSYLFVELIVGLLFLLSALELMPTGSSAIGLAVLAKLLLYWYAIAVLTVVFVFDLKYMLILRKVTFPAAVLVFLANWALGMEVWRLLVGIAACAGFFYLQRLLSNGRWIGGGDVQLGIFMGALLGFPQVLVAMFIAYLSGSLIGIVLLSAKRKGWKSELPFGTFLAASTVLVMLYGEQILQWYFGLM